MTTLSKQRGSGILAHITSLPSPFGIGDIGHAAYDFLDFLYNSGQRAWQFLPTNPTSPAFDNSPYMSISAFAGSPLLISLELLAEERLISLADIKGTQELSEYVTDYKTVTALKNTMLERAFNAFDLEDKRYLRFVETCPWLRDYTIFMALKEEYDQKGWFSWPEKIASRQKAALEEAEQKHSARMTYFSFEQFVFFSQWQKLREKAKKKNIRLIGDLPIYVGWDSVDVWANQSIFSLDDKTHKPTEVAGVPPDYFSKTGQCWGNPLYRWNCRDEKVKRQLFSWWSKRFYAVFQMVDTVRVDHFRGFESFWAIPASHKTAVKGEWREGPGIAFFQEMEKSLGQLDIIAEDLGEITPEVIELKRKTGFPGMKVLQFAFDGSRDNPFLPYNFTTPNSVIYTGTHDNDTSVGWFLSDQLNDGQRARIKQFCNRNVSDKIEIHNDLIYLAFSSISCLALIPLQDVLGFGNDCRMNSPGSKSGNWVWRCAPRFLTPGISTWLKEQCLLFGRLSANDNSTV